MPDSGEHLQAAAANAGLGLPPGGRLRLFKRLVVKACWPFLSRQIEVNRELVAELAAARHRLDRIDGDLEHHTGVLVRHEEPLDRHEFLLSNLEPAIGDLQRALDLVHDKIDLGQRQAVARFYDAVAPLDGSLSELSATLSELASDLARLSRRTDGLEEALAQRAEDVTGVANELFERTALQLGQVDLFLREVRRAFPEPPSADRLAAVPSGFAALYEAFEHAFRGTPSAIRARMAAYVDDLADRPDELPVLDVGCGRGELLELLAAAGIPAYGVDELESNARIGADKGLDVRREDLFEHLRGLAPGSLGAISAVHVLEHFAVDQVVEFLELAAAALAPGGLLLVETPNPENLVVGATTFYLDPTHVRPLPPALLEFLVGSRGFGDVELRRLRRPELAPPLPRPKPDEPWAEAVTPLVDVMNFHVFAPQDVAVLARRA